LDAFVIYQSQDITFAESWRLTACTDVSSPDVIKMDIRIVERFYNAADVTPRNAPDNRASHFAVERIWTQLEREIMPACKVLDLGCGAERYTFAAEKAGALPTGIDCAITPQRKVSHRDNFLFKYARQLATTCHSRAIFVRGNACDLSFRARMFGLVLLVGNNIVEYSYADIDRLLPHIQRVLTPGGRLCIEMRDGVAQWGLRNSPPGGYDDSTGLMKSESDIPGHGCVPYHTYFWTVGFASRLALFLAHTRRIFKRGEILARICQTIDTARKGITQ
jgi:SAM-dependent methyltransferase